MSTDKNPEGLNNSKLALDFSKEVWESEEIGNTSSPYLRITWFTIFESFRKCIEANNGDAPLRRIPIPAPTGTGKTLSMCYFMEKLEEQTGVLIVTSFIKEAKKIAERINKGSETIKAIDFHSESEHWTKKDEIKDYQVLVITHNMFISASDRRQNKVGIDRGKFDELYQYKEGARALTVIDESIETIQDDNLEYNDVHSLITALNGYKSHKDSDKSLHKEIQEEINTMTRLLDFFEIAKGYLSGKSETLIDKYMLNNYMEGYDMSFDTTQALSNNGSLRRFNPKVLDVNIKKNVVHILESIKIIMSASWMYYTRSCDALRTAREAAPKDISAVILDATSTINHSYRINPNVDFEIARMIPTGQVRNYQNVNLFLSKRQKTGQQQLIKQDNIDQYVEKIWEEIFNGFTVDSDDEVAIFTFQDIEDRLEKRIRRAELKNVHLGHYGNLTGKNDYKDCTKIFVIGIPFKPEFVTINTHALSTRGFVECFKDDKQIRDERLRLKYTEIAAELIQALNRSASRNTIDPEGNCPEVDIYMLMPDIKPLRDTIIESIQSSMPNINIGNWGFRLSDTNKRGPKSEHDDAFINKVKMLDEDVLFSSVSNELEMTRRQSENFRARLARAEECDPVVTCLSQSNVTFEKKGGKYWLTKC